MVAPSSVVDYMDGIESAGFWLHDIGNAQWQRRLREAVN